MDLKGEWAIVAHTPKGDFDWKLSMEPDGDSFTGTLDLVESKVALEEGRVEGNRLSWKSTLVVPRKLRFSGNATIEGDEIFGEIRMGAFGVRSFGGRRVATEPAG
ncbi:hypothetical protein [Micromonospora endolithica]|uniref:Lipid/polyisoprenoid-binding YceI-like domain-containing protein n=1 Tax=Micromonospora endolithica TaxID=230091 RepID=A0A3A9ZGQ3_9ACTN|nr:hypothetical protein [Micromonospora endolithica]RKN47500.1 hypothetical protein D7223_11975 [Micromonospora endolithica]TWJ21135.1 hypothetical protein JD76_01245 [Micromonospora endolithica]